MPKKIGKGKSSMNDNHFCMTTVDIAAALGIKRYEVDMIIAKAFTKIKTLSRFKDIQDFTK